jgi:pSer/pThr/pTyr-binding forkhead associated (FHA) protein
MMEVTLTIHEQTPRMVAVDSPEFVIGRAADCDLRLANPLVSRRHCMLTMQDGRVYVRDLNSSNGTGLNNQVLAGERPLHNGDELWVGATPVGVRIREDGKFAALVDEVFRTLWWAGSGPGEPRDGPGKRRARWKADTRPTGRRASGGRT